MGYIRSQGDRSTPEGNKELKWNSCAAFYLVFTPKDRKPAFSIRYKGLYHTTKVIFNINSSKEFYLFISSESYISITSKKNHPLTHLTTVLNGMGVFYHEEPPNPSRRCKFLRETLKDAFSNCRTFAGRLSTSNPEEAEDCPTSDFNDEEEVVLSAIRSRAMEKLKPKHYFTTTDSFTWVFSPKTGELFITPKAFQQREGTDGHYEKEEFSSVGSCFSCCSTTVSKEAFLSAKSNFSHCSSFKGFDIPDHWRRSILLEFCHCEGWPFGLCRKAVLLPPLPKSPSESWSWRKGTSVVKMHYV